MLQRTKVHPPNSKEPSTSVWIQSLSSTVYRKNKLVDLNQVYIHEQPLRNLRYPVYNLLILRANIAKNPKLERVIGDYDKKISGYDCQFSQIFLLKR